MHAVAKPIHKQTGEMRKEVSVIPLSRNPGKTYPTTGDSTTTGTCPIAEMNPAEASPWKQVSRSCAFWFSSNITYCSSSYREHVCLKTDIGLRGRRLQQLGK